MRLKVCGHRIDAKKLGGLGNEIDKEFSDRDVDTGAVSG